MLGSDTQKTVFFDTNVLNENGSYSLSWIVAKAMNLNPGDVVTAIQDNEEWDAKVVLDDDKWGLEIISDAKEFSIERSKGHDEGFWWGYRYQQVFLTKGLAKLGLGEPIKRQIYEGVGIVVNKDPYVERLRILIDAKRQRTIFFDTNVHNSNGSYSVHQIVAGAMDLTIGEIVTAIQDNEEWDAKVVSSGGEWGLELLSGAREVSTEKRRGHIEGFQKGVYCQQGFLSNVLARLDLDEMITRKISESAGIGVRQDIESLQVD
jgi:hypothetical protein